MKAINLFVDFEFTSLSPDAQPISVGIVSGNANDYKYPVGVVGWDKMSAMAFASERGLHFTNKKECVLLYLPEHFCSWVFSEIVLPEQVGKVEGYELSPEMNEAYEKALKMQVVKSEKSESKSFYAEFSDFDINRCDDWVKENVVGKLEMRDGYKMGKRISETNPHQTNVLYGTTDNIKKGLYFWLKQFSDYQITFVVDCGTWDWWFLMQLLAEWENVSIDDSVCPFCGDDGYYGMGLHEYKTGLPTLPINVSPVPMDLNDLIAHKKGISVREAFELDREELAYAENYKVMNSKVPVVSYKKGGIQFMDGELDRNKHNALFDCKVMKAIYEKLSV